MVALEAFWNKVRELADPLEPIEISLSEAVGLVLAEPALADVDLPPFDRAAAHGYAVKAAEATPGTLLRVIAPPTLDEEESEYELEGGESALVGVGAALPVGADSILAIESVRSESGSSGPRVVEVVEPTSLGRHVATRGGLLRSGETLLPAGTRLTPAMVGLLASQGCVHPICHRRVRVSVLAIGDHLVGPADAPILHRERNAANLALSTLLTGAGAMVHDLGCVTEAEAAAAMDRATTAPVVIVLGEMTGGLLRRMAHDGIEPIVSSFPFAQGDSIQYGITRNEHGIASTHLFHFSLDPVRAVIATALLAVPLVQRLQGGTEPAGPKRLRASWIGEAPQAGEFLQPVPVSVSSDEQGQLRVRPVPMRGPGDLPGMALANAIALVEPAGGSTESKLVDVVPLSPIPFDF